MPEAKDRESKTDARVLLGLAAVAALGLCVVGVLLIREFGFEGLFEWVLMGWRMLQAAPPIVFFGAMAILTIFPVPLTPFYITAGTLYGVGASLLWIPPAILLNNFIAYTLTTSFLRPWLQSIVATRGYSIPALESNREQTLFIILVRITPGPPYFLQSLVLGLAGVDRWRFLLISLPVHMIFVVGFVVLGQSAFEGELGLVVFAIALIFGVSICARFIHLKLRREGVPEPGSDVEPAVPSPRD